MGERFEKTTYAPFGICTEWYMHIYSLASENYDISFLVVPFLAYGFFGFSKPYF